MCFPLVKPRSADFSRYSGDRFRGKCAVMRTVPSQQNSTELLFIFLHLKIKNDKKNIRYKEQKVGINETLFYKSANYHFSFFFSTSFSDFKVCESSWTELKALHSTQ